MLQDLRYAFRQLARSPGFSLLAVVTLGLGIAGNATIATLLNTVFFQPLPVPDPGRLVAVYTADYSHGRYGASSYPDYVDMAAGLQSLEGLTGMALRPSALSAEGVESRRILLSEVAGDYFGLLKVPLALGRGLSADEILPGGSPTVVLSHTTWVNIFGADPGILGRTVQLGRAPFTVVGVAAAGYTGLFRGVTEGAWVSQAMAPVLHPGSESLSSRGDRGTLLYGRLRPGATLAGVRAEATVLASRLFGSYPDQWRTAQGNGREISVLPESEVRVLPMVRGAVLGAGALLVVVVGMVLLIACANLANLVLARSSARRREFAVRLALGAGRARLVRQLLVENIVLASLGGIAGMGLAMWLTLFISRFRFSDAIPFALDVRPDGRVFVAVALLALITGCLVGLAPALHASRLRLSEAIKDAAAGGGSHRSRFRSVFVMLQVGLSLVLLIGAGLFLRSLREATALDTGFGLRQAVLATMDLGLKQYPPERVQPFQDELRARVAAIPGVEAVALTSAMALSFDGGRRDIVPQGYRIGDGEDMEIYWANVSDGYFETMQLPVPQGRSFSEADRAGAPGVVIVNQALVRRFWPGQSGLGQQLSVTGPEGPFLQVVGVTGDGKYRSLGEDPTPFFYLPLAQEPAQQFTVVARTALDPDALVPSLRAAIHGLDAGLPLDRLGTYDDHVGLALLPARVAVAILGTLGMLGLVLAGLGIAGVVAFGVSQRVREIGIRIALGAEQGQVIWLIVADALRLVGMGAVVGVGIALPLAYLARSFLYGVSPVDPVAVTAAVLLFGVVALVASYLPARRAARVDPMVALRAE